MTDSQHITESRRATWAKYLLRLAAPVLILAAGVGAMFSLGRGKQDQRSPEPDDAGPEVMTVTAQTHRGGLDIEVDGVVAPFREIEVAAEVSGRVQFKADACRAGSFVRQGTPLVKIEPSDYELERDRSAGLYQQAIADLEENGVEISNIESLIALANQDLVLQQKELQRLVGLRVGVTESDVDKARQAVVQAENALQTLQNQLRSTKIHAARLEIAKQVAKSGLDKAELDLRRTEIRAPVDGVIVRDSVERGAYVQKGTPLFAIEDTSSVEVQCNLEMDQLYWLWRQPAVGTAPATDPVQRAYEIPRTPAIVYYQFADRADLRFAWKGFLSRYDGMGVDERTRTVPCRVVVERPTEVEAAGRSAADGGPPALVRGMYVTVVIRARPAATFLKIPADAVQPGKWVWRVENGKLRRCDHLALVRLEREGDAGAAGRSYWLTPAGRSGLAEGHQIVVWPPPGAYDGMPVQVKTLKQGVSPQPE